MDKIPGIILFGPPYVGKGTLATNIYTKNPSLFYPFSSGDMFRNMDPTTELGKYIKKTIDSGHLIPDKETIMLFESHLEKLISQKLFNPEKQIIIADGIPRTWGQIEPFNEIIDTKAFINLYATVETLIGRLKKRSLTSDRKDDKLEFGLDRINTYETITKIVSTHPSYSAKLISIDARGNELEVYNKAERFLREMYVLR